MSIQGPSNSPEKEVSSAAINPPDDLSSGSYNDPNFLMILFEALLGSVYTVQDLAVTASDMVQANAALQEKNNNLIMQFKFNVLPKDAGTVTIDQINAENTNVQFQRDNFQGIVITLRQKGRVSMTQAHSIISYLQQNSSELSSVLKIMTVLSKLVNDMNKPKT